MTQPLSINDCVIEDSFRLVELAERNALTNELLPFHGAKCGCRLCITDRWTRSPEAAEFARRKR
jgi:hypothetical protein